MGELDGDWEAPEIPNPEYQGPWEHPLIDNPEYEYDSEIYKYSSNAFVGIEIWQVKSGTIFDNILITDNLEVAAQAADKINEARDVEEQLEAEALELQRQEEEAERARLEAELEEEDEDEAEDE